MTYSDHILSWAAVVLCLPGKGVRFSSDASDCEPLKENKKRSHNSFWAQIHKINVSNIEEEHSFLEDQHSLTVTSILPLSRCIPGLLAPSARREGRRSPTWHEVRTIPKQPVNLTP